MKTKKNTYITLLTLAILCGACKNQAVDYALFEITDERVQPESNGAAISGTYSFTGEVNGMKINMGLDEQLVDAVTYPLNLEGCDFSVSIDSLKPNTTYYYCYSIDFGLQKDYLLEVSSFTTLHGVPEVKTMEVTYVDSTSYYVKGMVVTDNGSPITERGVCWNTSGNPDPLTDEVIKYSENGIGEYKCLLSQLAYNTKYYVCAYAKNAKGMGIGRTLEFQTEVLLELPTVITAEIDDITATTATGGGKVTDDGQNAVSCCGVCWSTDHYPTIEDDHTSDGSGLGDFTSYITELIPNMTYYVRAYATNIKGTAYGNEVSFTTLASLPTVITTDSVTNITASSATGNGNVTDDGGNTVSERGLCWSTSHNPTINNHKVQAGNGTGEFTATLTGLEANTTYYMKAYAINGVGTSYGEEVQFTTPTVFVPTVTTTNVTNIGQTSATGGGNVIADGGLTVTERGVCWSTSHNPVVTGNHTPSGTGTGSFTVNMTGLTAGTTYYVRAYAKNSQGTAYGDEVQFTTNSIGMPTVTTNSVTNITSNSATCGGNVTADGGATVTAKGVCWSTNQNPTLENCLGRTTDGNGLGGFTSQITGLTQGRTYYVRAYATNSAGTSYGTQNTFTTTDVVLPTVTTSNVTNITQNTAVCGGNVTNDGGGSVIERGVCWAMTPNPTINNYCTHDGSGTGSFTSNLTGLIANKIYYVRAYTKNSAGISYGDTKTFTTSSGL